VRSDVGLSLVEVLVAMIVIGTVMGAMAPFLVRSVSVVGQERSKQVAVEVANDALERARALDPSSLLAGRSKIKTQSQWNAAPAAVTGYLATMAQDWDPLLPDDSDAGLQAPLPTTSNPVTVVGTPYTQSWYVGRCWQTKVYNLTAGACGPAISDVPFFRIVAVVTWSHRSCPGSSCIYIASTLASIGPDPRFDLNRPPPVITDIADQTGYRGVVEDPLQLVVTGGQLPLAWTSLNLPPGLVVSPLGGLITGTPTAAGTYPVVITATGRDGKADNVQFTWIIALVPTLTNPGTQLETAGVQISPLAIVATGGLLPLKWTATGQPAGIAFNTTTGVFTGTATTVQTRTVVVTITDAGVPARTASVTFSWQVFTSVTIYNPGAQSIGLGTSIDPGTFALYATGGAAPYLWQASNLPRGLVLNTTTGAITGTVTSGTRYLTGLSVTDAAGDVDSITVLVNVTGSYTDFRVTSPNPAGPDRSSVAYSTPTLTATAAGGNTYYSYTWTAAGLPTGLQLSTSGVLSGRPTTRGSYVVTFTATDRNARTAVLMFVWTVT
jgi:type II secretory pathway pseudopilin PulG